MATWNQKQAICGRCGRDLRGARSFVFRPPGASLAGSQGESAGGATKCLTCALLHGPMLKRSAVAAIVVGTILTGLNQGDLLVSGQWNNAMYWKIPLTYCVPFLVATYGALTNSRR